MYHKQDSEYKLPKAMVYMSLYSKYAGASDRNMLLTELWCQCLQEELNAYSYDASIAGLNYRLA